MEWVSSKHHATAEHILSNTVQTLPAEARTLAAIGRLTCYSCLVTWTCPLTERQNSGSAHVTSHSNCSTADITILLGNVATSLGNLLPVFLDNCVVSKHQENQLTSDAQSS
jgi:hypothetical protein